MLQAPHCSSVSAGQVVRIQRWWRKHMRLIRGQRLLLELYWNRREKLLVARSHRGVCCNLSLCCLCSAAAL